MRTTSQTSHLLQMLNQDPYRDCHRPVGMSQRSSTKRAGTLTPQLFFFVFEDTGLGWGWGAKPCQRLKIVLIFQNGLKWNVGFWHSVLHVSFTPICSQVSLSQQR